MLVNHLVISFVAFITKVFEEPRKQITNLFFYLLFHLLVLVRFLFQQSFGEKISLFR